MVLEDIYIILIDRRTASGLRVNSNCSKTSTQSAGAAIYGAAPCAKATDCGTGSSTGPTAKTADCCR